MSEPHVSALQLDALALGGLAPEQAAHVRAHLARCSRCLEDERAAAEQRAGFVARVLPHGLRARRAVPGWWLAPALAVAAAVVIATWPRPEIGPLPDELAIKGDASWQVFANRGSRVFAVRDGAALASGDQLRFAVTPGAARYVLIASVDGMGGVTIYYPYQGAHSVAIDGERVELPGSIVLDAAPGPERIYALLSDAPIAAELVRAQLRGVARGGAAAIRGTRRLAVPVDAQLSIVFEKEGP